MDKKTLREAQYRVAEAKSFVEVVRNDEQEKFDDKSDTWKESDKGQAAEEKISLLTDAIDALEGIDENLEQAMSD